MTAVTLHGDWTRMLDIRCAACEKNSDPLRVWDIPVMLRRGSVPLEGLAEALRKTAEEQKQVIAAMKLGIDGPYTFEDSRWEIPSEPLEWP